MKELFEGQRAEALECYINFDIDLLSKIKHFEGSRHIYRFVVLAVYFLTLYIIIHLNITCFSGSLCEMIKIQFSLMT